MHNTANKTQEPSNEHQNEQQINNRTREFDHC